MLTLNFAGAADAITAAMFHVTNFIEAGIRQEAIISTCVVLIWVIIALVGIARAVFFMLKGGDDGTWQANLISNGDSTTEKSHELVYIPRVPTYEQATQDRAGNINDNSANRYRGQTYTLASRPQPPIPTLEVHSATSPMLHTGFSPANEKMGTVNGQNVDTAIRRPTHIRASSHGNYEVTSPENQYNGTNLQSTQNPFADPVR